MNATRQHDANGNQLNSTGLSQILWNANGQPRSVTPLSGGAISGTFDALGRLVENGSGSAYTQFVFSPSGQKIASVQAGTLIKGTVPLPGGATAIYSGTTGMPYIRHLDWLGSARLSTTWSHTVQSKVAYAPFGETYNEAGASSNDRSFTGQDQDTVSGNAATGIYDFLFRKYDPAAGRWLSPDPSGWEAAAESDPQSLDRYAYVGNRPMTYRDIKGLDCVYMDNNDTSIESVDHNSNSGECWQNGGYWADGFVPNDNSWINVNSDTGQILIYSVLGSGAEALTLANGGIGFGADPSQTQMSMQLWSESQYRFPGLLSFGFGVVSDLSTMAMGGLYDAATSSAAFRFAGTRYCGPGGGGAPNSAVDLACAVHDAAYDALGVSASANFGTPSSPWQKVGMQAANQSLYNSAVANQWDAGASSIRAWLGSGAFVAAGTGVNNSGGINNFPVSATGTW